MFSKSFKLQEIQRILRNANNPKTMDYYFAKFLGLDLAETEGSLEFTGIFSYSIKSNNSVLSAAFMLLNKDIYRGYGNSTAGKFRTLFVISTFENHKFPKCRVIKIVGSRSNRVHTLNPKRGQVTEFKTHGGHTWCRTEPSYTDVSKPFLLYARGNWDRKTELKLKSADV